MSISVFTVGTNTNKIDDLFSSVGLIFPAKTKLGENYQKLKPFIMDMSKIELKKNRINYCRIIRSEKDYSGDILFENKI